MESNNVFPLSADQTRLYALKERLNQLILGQEKLISRLIIALLADGHLLVEGAPGLAKTKAIKELSSGIEGSFHRVQFTPDLLPSDLTGTDIYHHDSGGFSFQPGPIFHNLLLADEINRAPAKVQSALLEAMAERQVTIGRKTYQLPELFLVMATQNPIEQEGTYPLPEAQLDRFLMYVTIDYPDSKSEHAILNLARNEALQTLENKVFKQETLPQETILTARKAILQLHMSQEVENYIVQLILASRKPGNYAKQYANWIRFGSSPRGTIALDRCARAHAWLNNKNYVSPEDVQAVCHDVLRHRILLSFEAEADGITSDQFINELLQVVPVP